ESGEENLNPAEDHDPSAWRGTIGGGKGRDGLPVAGGEVVSGTAATGPVPPGRLPHRPRTEERRRHVQENPAGRGPRDRGSRLTCPTVMRRHLPPPPFGETM
ncbi:unnamed protein product, partial [Discosporangium mesarthrocarpum]